MTAPMLMLVGANKGGVGKTTVCRLLLEHLNAPGMGYKVYDSESPRGSLVRFWADAKIVDLSRTQDRMEVLDGVAHAPVTVVDVRAGSMIALLRTASDLGLLEDAAADRMRLTVVHVLGPSVDSLGEAAEVASFMATGSRHYLVKNSVTDETFEWEHGSQRWAFDAIAPSGVISVPHLDGVTREATDMRGGTFGAFERDERLSMVQRRTLRKWLRDVGEQLDFVKLGDHVRGGQLVTHPQLRAVQ